SDEGFTARPNRHRTATVVHVLAADLSQPFGETVSQLRTIGVPVDEGLDADVANLMIHYFTHSTEAMSNFAALCRATVKINGQVIITAMMGNRVHDTF